MSAKKTPPDRELRLKKLAERELDPKALEQAAGGLKGGLSPSRYCSL